MCQTNNEKNWYDEHQNHHIPTLDLEASTPEKITVFCRVCGDWLYSHQLPPLEKIPLVNCVERLEAQKQGIDFMSALNNMAKSRWEIKF